MELCYTPDYFFIFLIKKNLHEYEVYGFFDSEVDMIPTLREIKCKLSGNDYCNEDQVRFSLVTRILQKLGWDIWNPNECCFEISLTIYKENMIKTNYYNIDNLHYFNQIECLCTNVVKSITNTNSKLIRIKIKNNYYKKIDFDHRNIN